MIDLKEYQKLKDKSEKAKADFSRAEGALSQQMKKLEEDFDCDSIEKAEKLLTKLEKEEKNAEKEYEKEFTTFKEKWEEKL